MKPSAQQLQFLDWEMGIFFHFGIRTFYEGHKDWDFAPMSAEQFNPSDLDCEQWIKTARDAGMKYAILVTKHHDGFALWPSKYTNYSVRQSPWKNGEGDVVREYVTACRKFGLKVGLYYSPAEFESRNKTHREYDDYFINQINELLGNYGKIDYLWFDGCGSEGHTYDTARIVAEIRRLQPEILIFNMWDPDTRWAGNESGLAHLINHNVVDALDFSVQTDVKDCLDAPRFLPVECDCRMRLANWFYSQQDEATVKTVDELVGLYYYSVGRGANLLLNIGPDRRGLLPDKDAAHLLSFGQEIKRRFSNPASTILDAAYQNEASAYTVEFDAPRLINHVVLEEDLSDGGQIEQFKIQIHPYSHGMPVTVYEGHTIGHKAICSFPTVKTKKIDVVLLEPKGPETLRQLKTFYVK